VDPITTQAALSVVGGLFVAIVAWLGQRLHARQDAFDKRQREFEAQLAEKADSSDIKDIQKDIKDLAKDLEARFNNGLDRQTSLIVRLLKGSIND
jgi:hypothetical protein